MRSSASSSWLSSLPSGAATAVGNSASFSQLDPSLRSSRISSNNLPYGLSNSAELISLASQSQQQQGVQQQQQLVRSFTQRSDSETSKSSSLGMLMPGSGEAMGSGSGPQGLAATTPGSGLSSSVPHLNFSRSMGVLGRVGGDGEGGIGSLSSSMGALGGTKRFISSADGEAGPGVMGLLPRVASQRAATEPCSPGIKAMLSRPELALCLLAEIAYEHDEDFTGHLALLLHAVLLVVDAEEALVAGHAQQLLINCLYSLSARALDVQQEEDRGTDPWKV